MRGGVCVRAKEDEDIVEEERLADDKGFGDADRNQGQSKLVQDILSRQAEQEAAAKAGAREDVSAVCPEWHERCSDMVCVCMLRTDRIWKRGRTLKTRAEAFAWASSGKQVRHHPSWKPRLNVTCVSFPAGAGDKKGGGVTTGGGDVERLRKAVQVLVQQTGPLGTCMDYIQEDVGIMVMELHRWEEECRKCVSWLVAVTDKTYG